MDIIQGTADIRLDFPTAVTLGKFDGLHLGHRKLIRAMLAEKKPGWRTVVFTFDTPPSELLSARPAPLLTVRGEKRRILEEMGVDLLIEYPFTDATRRMSGEDFVRDILSDRLRAAAVFAGPDCGFGYRRSGNAELLDRLSARCGYALRIIGKELAADNGEIISSSLIRKELTEGNLARANRLLGYAYGITSPADAARGGEICLPLTVLEDGPAIAAEDGQYKVCPREGRYLSSVRTGNTERKSMTEIRTDTAAGGVMRTVYEGEISAEKWPFGVKISMIAQL